jgi:predicted outer membrane repeat protein
VRIVLGFALLGPSAASAATLDVCGTCTYTTINGALSAAASGDTIKVAAGTYNEQVVLGKNVSIVGAGSGSTTITTTSNPPLHVAGTTAAALSGFTIEPVDAYDQAITVAAAAVDLTDVVVTDVSGSSNGQCVAISGASDVAMTDVTLTNCDTTWGYGGAIYVSASSLSLTSSSVSSSYAYQGAAIYATTGAAVTITDSTLSSNEAYDTGGAVWLSSSTLDSARATISSNKSTTNDAAGVYGYLATWTDEDSVLDGNSVPSCGTAAWLSTSTFTGTGTSFTSNAAGDCGGAIRGYYTNVSLTDATFDGNTSAATGGGHLYLEGGDLTLSGGAFSNGSTGGNGGAIWKYLGTTTITGTTFDTHSAVYGGTVLVSTPTAFTLDGVTMSAGTTTYQGAHMYAAYGPIVIRDSTIETGSADTEVGGVLAVYGSLEISGSTFADNTSKSWGGGVYGYYAPVTITDSAFERNVATAGGHVLVYTEDLDVAGTAFSDGVAQVGSAILDYYGDVSIDTSSFTGNAASSYGTVMVEDGVSLDITDSEFSGNTGVLWHGGAYWRWTGGSVSGTTFSGNDGGAGGGAVAVWADESVSVSDCVFESNVGDQGGAVAYYGYSGGLGALTVTGSSFSANSADVTDGGAIYVQSGGDLVLTGNVLSGNTAVDRGGAVAVVTADSVQATANTLCGNAAGDGGGAWIGYVSPATDHAWTANVWADNAATDAGGGLYVTTAAGSLTNNDLVGNEAASAAGGAIYTDSNLALKNNLVAWTVGGDALVTTSAVTTSTMSLTYNDFWANTSADASGGITTLPSTNMALDPGLASYAPGDGCAGDFKLASGSLLRDAGDPGVLDPDGSRSDVGAYGGPAATAVDHDGDGAYDDTDCDDDVATVFPGAEEVCDDVDQDCDGVADDGATDAITWYLDQDDDGHAGPTTSVACDAPENGFLTKTDCDDGNADVSPDALEICDGIDDDCDGSIDEEDAADAPAWYADSDGDGFGDASVTAWACEAPAGYVDNDDDCGDEWPDVHPGAVETCDGLDEDCDGVADDGAVDRTWYADADGDGFGDDSETVVSCERPEGHVLEGGDCDDADAAAFPGADEIAGDGVDQDCDGKDGDVPLDTDEPDYESTRTWDPAGSDSGVDQPKGVGCGCDGTGGAGSSVMVLVAALLAIRRRPEIVRPRLTGQNPGLYSDLEAR